MYELKLEYQPGAGIDRGVRMKVFTFIAGPEQIRTQNVVDEIDVAVGLQTFLLEI